MKHLIDIMELTTDEIDGMIETAKDTSLIPISTMKMQGKETCDAVFRTVNKDKTKL